MNLRSHHSFEGHGGLLQGKNLDHGNNVGENAKVQGVSSVSSNPARDRSYAPHELNWRNLQWVIDKGDDYQLAVAGKSFDQFSDGFAVWRSAKDGSGSAKLGQFFRSVSCVCVDVNVGAEFVG